MMDNEEYFDELQVSDQVYARESLMMNVTEDILVAMEDKNISKVGLARLLNKSKSFVTQMLGGSRNMTLRTLADIALALDMEVSITFTSKKKALDNNTVLLNSSVLTNLVPHQQRQPQNASDGIPMQNVGRATHN